MTKFYLGLFHLPWWGYLIVTLGLTHITIAAVTIYLHRCQAHRALSLHSSVSHFFRFWLWLTTGMRTIEWVAIHRKHHAHSDKKGDPHSPLVFGVKRVLFSGAELYRDESENAETMTRYGHNTPHDWLEKRIYHPHNYTGIFIMMLIDVVCFGFPGLSIWAVQMMWIPFFAAGVVNGIGHFFGYRNYECADNARNILPWGILIGGEELHNNHHTYATSAKLSDKWWEFDIGWLYIRLLSLCGLATVRKTPPKEILTPVATATDFINIDTIKSILRNRFTIIANYNKQVLVPILKAEKIKFNAEQTHKKLLHRAKGLLIREPSLVDTKGASKLKQILEAFEALRTAYTLRVKLQAIWQQHTASPKELVESLQEWCQQAEATGIAALTEFSNYLRCQSLPLAR